MDLVGGAWTPTAVTFRKFYMSKRKNLDPWGRGVCWARPLDPYVYVTFFFMFSNTYLHVMSQCHDVTPTLIAIQYDSLCANCRYLKTGLVDYIGVLQATMILLLGCPLSHRLPLVCCKHSNRYLLFPITSDITAGQHFTIFFVRQRVHARS